LKSGTPAERRRNPSLSFSADLPGASAPFQRREQTNNATGHSEAGRKRRPEQQDGIADAADRTKTGSGNPQGLRAHSRQKPDAKRPLFGQAMRPQAWGRGTVPLERRRRTGGNRAGRRTGGAGRTEQHTQEAATAWPPCLHAGTAGTAGRPGKSGRSRGGGIVAAKDKPNRREPCRAGGRWGGLNRSRRRTRPRRPGRPFLRGMPRIRAAGPGADGAARVGEKVLQMSASDSRKSPAVMQSFCVKKLSLSSCQAIRSGVRSIRLET